MERRTFSSLADIESLERWPYEDVVPVTSTLAIFERSARLFGQRIALSYLESGEVGTPVREFTYAELLANICRAANLFRSLGVGPQDAVAILAPNMPETHFALWGAQVAGRACPINHLLSAEHVVALAKAAGACVAVVLGPNPEVDIWRRAGALRAAGVQVLQIAVDRTPASDTPVFQDLLAAQPDALVFEPGLTRERIAACFHTGGTTGAPKLALHTHGNEVHTSWFAPCYYDFDEHTVEINGFPLFHVAGAFVYGLACFSVGARQILPTLSGMRSVAFVRNYWHFCERFSVTALACVPTIMATLLGQPPGGAAARSVKVALTGGSPLPSELAVQFEAHTGIPVRNILGMTESAGLVTIGLARAPRTGVDRAAHAVQRMPRVSPGRRRAGLRATLRRRRDRRDRAARPACEPGLFSCRAQRRHVHRRRLAGQRRPRPCRRRRQRVRHRALQGRDHPRRA